MKTKRTRMGVALLMFHLALQENKCLACAVDAVAQSFNMGPQERETFKLLVAASIVDALELPANDNQPLIIIPRNSHVGHS